ncbi:MAG: hypothetical protein DMG97_33785 [Acidobacteria bacterium]|nr:MAG: hypothetical protein DMG97_33785 [Acidobacteriota bacterium]
MDLWRSRWILGVVLGSFAVVGTPAGADEPNFTEEQKTDFMRKQAKVCRKPGKRGKSNVTPDAQRPKGHPRRVFSAH